MLNDFRPVVLMSHMMTLEWLHRACTHLDKGSNAVRIMFFDFSRAFITIQSLLLRDELTEMRRDSHLVTWMLDYLTGRPQYVRPIGTAPLRLWSVALAHHMGLCLAYPLLFLHSLSHATCRSSQMTLRLWGVLRADRRGSTGAW